MRRVLCISDLHIGSVFGIFPKAYKTRHQNEIQLNPLQLELWDKWELMKEEIADDYDYIFLLGDLIDGLNRKGANRERIISNLNEQTDATLKLLRPLCKRKEVIGITSTPYHNSADYEVDRSICKALKGHFLGSIANIRIKNTNKVINIAHGAGASPIYAGTKASKDILLALSSEQLKKTPDVDLICLSEDTEILTKEGWKFRNEITYNDRPLTFNLNDNSIEIDYVKEIIDLDFNGNAYTNKRIPFLVSPNHRIIYKWWSVSKEWQIKRAKDFNGSYGGIFIPLAGNINPRYIKKQKDDLVALAGWLISEGSFIKEHNGIRISQGDIHQDYINEIRKILERLEIDFTEHNTGNSMPFYINASSGKEIRKLIPEKNIPEWVNYLDNRQFDIFFHALVKGDGSFYPTWHSGKYYSGDKKIIDRLQTALLLHGYRSQFRWKKGGFKNGGWVLGWVKSPIISLEHKPFITPIPYKGKMWSVNTWNTTLIARRNGYEFITGNCRAHHHSFLHLEMLGKHIIWNPCWEGPRLNTYSMNHYHRWQPDIGVTMIEISEDEINIKPFLYQLEHERKNIKVI